MANITVRTSTTATDPSSTSAKGSALSHTELDSNFILLNNEKLENTGTPDLTGSLQVKGSGGSAVGAVRFFDNDDSNYVELKSPATVSSNETFILPAADGSAGQFLKTDGSGNLSFATVSGGGGVSLSGSTNNTIATVTGADAIAGETNLTFDGSILGVAGTQTITNTTTSDSLTITTTENSSTAGPVVSLKRNSASPADNDSIGAINFKGEDDADAEIEYASIKAKIGDVTSSGSTQDGILELNTVGSSGFINLNNNVTIPDNKYLHFGTDLDAYIGLNTSKTQLDAVVSGNFELKATDSGASGKGNVVIRADTKMELRAGTDRDSKGDLFLTSFDDFQFRKLGYQSSDTNVAPTTNGSTTVTLSRSLTAGETKAFNEGSLVFYDNSSFSSSDLRDMGNYREVTGTSGSGASTTITLEEAVSNLSNATHSTGKYLQFTANSTAVVVDGTRGRLDSKTFGIQNRIGTEGPQDLKLSFTSIQFNDGEEFLGTNPALADTSNQYDVEEIPVEYTLKTQADKNTFDLEHHIKTGNSGDGDEVDTTTNIFQVKKRSSTASSIGAGVTIPEVFTFGVNPQLPSYAVSALPAGALAGEMAFCTDETGGAVMVFSDGTNWRRCTDRAVAS